MAARRAAGRFRHGRFRPGVERESHAGRRRDFCLSCAPTPPRGLFLWQPESSLGIGAGAISPSGTFRGVAAGQGLSQPGRCQEVRSAPAQNRLWELGLRNARIFGSGSEFERLRDYQPDDEYRRINWKATARRGKPISIEFET
ncbi:MAG: DUF58 domain-containing protein, partial [Caldilineaceae bacterium]|nr:DUF58 domain-containing protein [Caldilineaceae bacterium]